MKRPTGTPKRTGRSPVADKRGLSKPSDGKKTGVKRHSTRPKRRGNAVVRAITGTVSLIWRIIWGSVWRLTMVVLLIIGAASAYYYTGLPEPEDLFDARARGSVTMLDHEDRVFAWRGETFGTVTSDKIAPVLRQAVVATEDRRFFSHLGVSPRGIAGAIRINLAEGRGPLEGNGGSTITQQVAKLLCLGETFDPIRWKNEAEFEADCRVGSLWRKVKEVPFALALEAKYSKDDILNIYMNRSYLGAGARGFEAASQRYFNKPATDVTPAEAAMLAGLLKAPSYFAPTANLQRSQDRASVILGLMHEQDYLDDTQFAEAKANPAVLSKAASERAGGYFADWVMETGPGFLTSETTEDVTVKTTFDQRIQRAAERAVKRIFDEKVKEGSKAQVAVVVMSADGAVRAMIGGRDTTVNGAFNRAIQAKRQTGSSFKPFVYAASLEAGHSPSDIVQDGPLTIRMSGGRTWSPQNYTRRFYGPVTLTDALKRSLNTATIRVQESVGRDAVRRVAHDFGIVSNLTSSPSLGLGASEATLLELTGAYAGIRNGGTSVAPYGLVELNIKGDDQPLMGQMGGMGARVISQRAAGQLIYMMQQVIGSGTGTRAQLGDRPAAGKTGTTSSYRDAWFVGFTEQYVTGVWMGYDDNTPLKGVTGGGLPAEIWQAVMSEIHDGLPVLPLSTVSPDGSGIIMSQGQGTPKVVTSGSADDPLAAALAGVMNGADSQRRAAQNGGGRVITAPTEVGGSGAPQTSGSSSSASSDDALSRALNGILGGN
ncbi:penicillin-binding protein [Paracoccus sp. R12_1]|jgi:penicillin-binding protein 1A|uniref:transglycosylase domain-containing protein n=1 Tax=unclassified Paracoccus (in: a-proteobacteria) TaxID=2688777 RepID=UPI001ADC0B6D|nr:MULTISPECIES: transglycosylase domain-containing protein [unclassified Paracoccus (in: a-proteobacteria)]MBO9453864.1 penicillin-binding protein [Paracoccus sp. R12_2]MBO9486712.1 penicillin-binding protein [Paracoccus sp. R12_1]